MELERFDAAVFLRDHWQRRPLLIRNPWASWSNPLEPDDLAGLACESGVESRLVRGRSVEHGPIPEERFGELGASDWTLLVQAVDHHVPAVAALIEPFRFVPNWRIDDVMVSYAVDGGGVGPHFDQYDVFLIQGLGRRRWRIGPRCDETTRLLAHDDLRLLAEFAATDEWVLEPGDILYVPPGFAHDGVAVGGDCMTYSIGFRAPSRRELIAAWCDEVLADLTDADRYGDPGLARQDNPGEISPDALARLLALVTERIADADAFARWFGRFNSVPRYPEIDWSPEEPIGPEDLVAGVILVRNPASRFAFIAGPPTLLFVDGEEFACRDDMVALAERLCAAPEMEIPASLSAAARDLLHTLCNRGCLGLG